MEIAKLNAELKEFEELHTKKVKKEMQNILEDLGLDKKVLSKHGIGVIKIKEYGNSISTILEYKFYPYTKEGKISVNSKYCGLYITQTSTNEEIKRELLKAFKQVEAL